METKPRTTAPSLPPSLPPFSPPCARFFFWVAASHVFFACSQRNEEDPSIRPSMKRARPSFVIGFCPCHLSIGCEPPSIPYSPIIDPLSYFLRSAPNLASRNFSKLRCVHTRAPDPFLSNSIPIIHLSILHLLLRKRSLLVKRNNR